MKPTVYLETTIPGYLCAWPSRDILVAAQQHITREWWLTRRADFELRISRVVLDEAAAGDAVAAAERLVELRDILILSISEDAIRLCLKTPKGRKLP